MALERGSCLSPMMKHTCINEFNETALQVAENYFFFFLLLTPCGRMYSSLFPRNETRMNAWWTGRFRSLSRKSVSLRRWLLPFLLSVARRSHTRIPACAVPTVAERGLVDKCCSVRLQPFHFSDKSHRFCQSRSTTGSGAAELFPVERLFQFAVNVTQ